MFKNLIFIFIFIISANVAYSKSFNINCKINTGYEYNRGTDISGKYMPDSEGKSSGITENWNFIYSGQGPEILINNPDLKKDAWEDLKEIKRQLGG